MYCTWGCLLFSFPRYRMTTSSRYSRPRLASLPSPRQTFPLILAHLPALRAVPPGFIIRAPHATPNLNSLVTVLSVRVTPNSIRSPCSQFFSSKALFVLTPSPGFLSAFPSVLSFSEVHPMVVAVNGDACVILLTFSRMMVTRWACYTHVRATARILASGVGIVSSDDCSVNKLATPAWQSISSCSQLGPGCGRVTERMMLLFDLLLWCFSLAIL